MPRPHSAESLFTCPIWSTATYPAFLLLFCLASVLSLPAQTFTTVHSFNSGAGEGAGPYGALVQGFDGNFYGTTSWGGSHTLGTIFRVTPDGALTTLFNFTNQDENGQQPECTLVFGADGNLYGVTLFGGQYGNGTVFRFSLSTNTLTTLHAFTLEENANAYGGLVQADNGNLYGTTVGSLYGRAMIASRGVWRCL